MITNNSDRSWEQFGQDNPYYGVLTDEKFNSANLNNELRAEFFGGGRVHVEKTLATVRDHFGDVSSLKSALDFGCGVGRLVMPLAESFVHVTGVDISPSMLREAERNCRERHISNVEFVLSDDKLSRVVHKFDLIHSVIVLQHIPVSRGEEIIRHLVERLNPNGILAIHLPFRDRASASRRSINFLQRSFAPLAMLANVSRGRSWNAPLMQMNHYDLNRILSLLSSYGMREYFVEVIEGKRYSCGFIFAKLPSR